MTRSAWKRRIYIGKAVCAASTSATRAVPWLPPAPLQASRPPGEPINHAQTRTTPRHPAERSMRAGPHPCFRQSRQTSRQKPKTFCAWLFAWSLPKPPALWRLWRATRLWQSPYSMEHVSWLLLSGIGAIITCATGAIYLRLQSFAHFDLQFLLYTAQVCSMFSLEPLSQESEHSTPGRQ